MFEVTAEDIALLDDKDLRSLVGRLCESEMRRRGISPLCVTWGGDQKAEDGGVDVRVALPHTVEAEGFIPRPDTVFQVKAEDTPASKILSEMRPNGILRPAIRELAGRSGAYIIVSSEAFTSDVPLQKRREAMTQAVSELPNADALHVDFYDRKRLETCLRDHTGTALWVRERIGKRLPGWSGFGAWSFQPEGPTSEYLLDGELRIKTHKQETSAGLSAIAGINRIRDVLRSPQGVVRMVGLSGVGKTRLAQALFDARIGEHSLDQGLATYTDLANEPNPQPTAVASELIANHQRAILIVDNCPPDLHRRLSEICRSQGSQLSVITIEYDIRDDQAEGTDVFALEAASINLTDRLIRHRFPDLSHLDSRRIAEFSGGNARIAIALAAQIDKDEAVAQLSDQELLVRLFQQRHLHDEALFIGAQALSLVYSFEGEAAREEGETELSLLGSLVSKSDQEMFMYSAEMERRGLVQRRNRWRAVLPHAIANGLASLGLQNIRAAEIDRCFVNGNSERLLRSFSHRLRYLHDSREARLIAKKWLGPHGLLGGIPDLNDLGHALFDNVAPVAPEITLAALERILLKPTDAEIPAKSKRYLYLLRSLAYDPAFFHRSIALIVTIAKAGDVDAHNDEGGRIFASLFLIYFSGTRATIDQRLAVLRPLIPSDNAKERTLGLAGLRATLEAIHFMAAGDFEFGAHSRDYGWSPRTPVEAKDWFEKALSLAGEFACADNPVAQHVREVLARQFRGLWTQATMYDELERISRAISARCFWKEGWIAVRQTIHFDSKGLPPEVSERLGAIEELLRPKDLLERVRAIVLSEGISIAGLDAADDQTAEILPFYRVESAAEALGREAAANEGVFAQVLPELTRSHELIWNFGKGLAQGAEKPLSTWDRLAAALAASGQQTPDFRVLHGFLNGLNAKDPELASVLLDGALRDERLAWVYPALQTAVGIDEKGVQRLMRSLELGKAPIRAYHSLVSGGVTHKIAGRDFNNLLLRIAVEPGGLDLAIEILHMRISFASNQSSPSELIDIGCELMRRLTFARRNDVDDYRLGIVARNCLVGHKGAATVREICRNLKDAVSKSETYPFYHAALLQLLFAAHPLAALDGLCGGDETDLRSGVNILDQAAQFRGNPFDEIPEGNLVAWCDQQPDVRYPAIAGGVTPFQHCGDPPRPQWTSIARKLLERAPDRVAVLKRFVDKFTPTAWTGQRAVIVESNAKLLDELAAYSDPALNEFVASEKKRLMAAIEEERTIDFLIDRERDERFE
jgi:hypothetical protein